ncbi:MAG: L,D-transpeptidase family protein [Kiritimatiellales bacterium]|nr:L,D-transpeptidase family protein [Kiritimatiellales bacterium]MCF7863546.1 L,D-transpeptidase family protein [Kiritimatiellales bacterium]
MAKPIYAGSYQNRGRNRGKVVFIVIVLAQLAAVGAYLYFKSDKKADSETPETAPPSLAPAPSALSPATPSVPANSPAAQAAVSDARAAIDAGQLTQAQAALSQVVATNPDPDAIKLLGDVNMKLLKSSLMMPGKQYYVIQSGDYLQKIAKKFNTTVELLKTMNGMQTDTIRLNDRMLVFNSDFSIRVSKERNELDLLNGGKLFKRYKVGTGKFGKTPAVQFSIIDKIIEPPWTRPSDNKQIEYGDPENVLGSRWMAIKSTDHPELTGFGIHGTWERDSIGKQSSAGCIRMLNEDVEELFDLVPRKTTVIIDE